MNKKFIPALLFSLLLTSAAHAAAAKISIASKGNEMAYTKTKLSAKAGSQVTLTFKNGAAQGSGLSHSWILVQPGTEQQVANDGIAAGPDKGYIPDSPSVLAHTKLIQPGETETITFTAPSAPGNYPYICTFPGHYPMMKGVLTVK